jgi:hypothetical protein
MTLKNERDKYTPIQYIYLFGCILSWWAHHIYWVYLEIPYGYSLIGQIRFAYDKIIDLAMGEGFLVGLFYTFTWPIQVLWLLKILIGYVGTALVVLTLIYVYRRWSKHCDEVTRAEAVG